jgi:FkbM family methyltransferase
LGKIATRIVQQSGDDGLEIAYIDGFWTRRVGRDFFPDGVRFEYTYANFDIWKRQADLFISQTKDFWLQQYRPKEGDVIVDVGAGRGEDTLTFSRAVGATGRVIAIEAHPLSFAILKNFCKLNRLTNVTPLHLALMDKPGTVRIIESASCWTMNAVDSGNGTSGVPVRAGTLDALCEAQKVDNIAFLKMNIEGAERYALLGAQAVMPRIRQICVACHDFRADMGHGEEFRTLAFVGRLLREHGFTLTSRPDDPRDYVRDHVYGLRPS